MRLQLALNVSDIDEAIEFYSKLFATRPAKRRPGYANFAIDEPPLKLVLFESTTGGGTLNHLGVEASAAAEVVSVERRLVESGMTTSGLDDTMCCYADKTETWVSDPDGVAWEWYVKTGDSEMFENVIVASLPSSANNVEAGVQPARCC